MIYSVVYVSIYYYNHCLNYHQLPTHVAYMINYVILINPITIYIFEKNTYCKLVLFLISHYHYLTYKNICNPLFIVVYYIEYNINLPFLIKPQSMPLCCCKSNVILLHNLLLTCFTPSIHVHYTSPLTRRSRFPHTYWINLVRVCDSCRVVFYMCFLIIYTDSIQVIDAHVYLLISIDNIKINCDTYYNLNIIRITEDIVYPFFHTTSVLRPTFDRFCFTISVYICCIAISYYYQIDNLVLVIVRISIFFKRLIIIMNGTNTTKKCHLYNDLFNMYTLFMMHALSILIKYSIIVIISKWTDLLTLHSFYYSHLNYCTIFKCHTCNTLKVIMKTYSLTWNHIVYVSTYLSQFSYFDFMKHCNIFICYCLHVLQYIIMECFETKDHSIILPLPHQFGYFIEYLSIKLNCNDVCMSLCAVYLINAHYTLMSGHKLKLVYTCNRDLIIIRSYYFIMVNSLYLHMYNCTNCFSYHYFIFYIRVCFHSQIYHVLFSRIMIFSYHLSTQVQPHPHTHRVSLNTCIHQSLVPYTTLLGQSRCAVNGIDMICTVTLPIAHIFYIPASHIIDLYWDTLYTYFALHYSPSYIAFPVIISLLQVILYMLTVYRQLLLQLSYQTTHYSCNIYTSVQFLSHNTYINHISDIVDTNPITTNAYRWAGIYPEHYTKAQIIVAPVLINPNPELPYNNLNDNEFNKSIIPSMPTGNSINNHNLGRINEDNIDYSNLGDVDPDLNFLNLNSNITCRIFTERSFNKMHSQHKFSIFHANIRSIPENLSKLIYYLQGIDHQFSIFAISETWLKNHNDSLYTMKGYTHTCVNREKRIGGGVALYINNSLSYNLRPDLFIDIVDVNVLFIEIDKSEMKTKANLLIGVCYRAPHVSPSDFIEKLDELLAKLHKEKSIVYFSGDFNLDTLYISPASSNKASEFQNTFLSYSYQPVINGHPTRETDLGSRTLIDNIYTNVTQSSDICHGGILETQFSDHYSILAITDFTFNIKKERTICKRDFSNKNKSQLRKKLKLQDWTYIYNIDSSPLAFSYFHNQFRYIFEECFPEKYTKITYSNRLPWLSKGLRISIQTKADLHEQFKANPTPENKLTYSKFRNKLTTLMRTTERQYHEDQLELQKNDLRKSWKIIKEIIGKCNTHAKSNLEFNINGLSVNNNQIISDSFNDYFINVGIKLAEEIKDTSNPLEYVDNIQNSIFMPHITETEVKNIIQSLKHSSPGWDGMPAHICIPPVDLYIKPLTFIINNSMSEGIFPDEMKLAKVIPIFKSGDKTMISNYRPISVLPFFSKIFEKIMYNHLLDFINENGILYKFQFGFRQKYSTNHAIILLVEKIRNALSTGKIMIGVFLDLKKAFDTVNHDILLRKLYQYGIRGNILSWLKSYLTNRKQFVFLNDTTSATKSISCGVPQGSVLGPLLFILYINDLPKASHLLTPILFADDTSLFIEGSSVLDTISILNNELEKITKWLASNKLTLNIVKSHYMIFHRARIKDEKCKVLLSNSTLDHVRFTKFLGMIIDEKLNFINHINYIKNKISKGLGIIIKARKYLNKNVLINLYNSYVFPYLIYCVEIWGNTCTTHLDPLIKLQKKIIRVISFSPYKSHTDPLFKNMKILSLNKIVVHRIGMQMYKYHHNTLPDVIIDLFTEHKTKHHHNTRHKHNFRHPLGKQEYMYRNFSFKGIYVWNYITSATNINLNAQCSTFKYIFKEHLLHNEVILRVN